MSSMVDPPPDGKTEAPATLRGVAERMSASPDPFVMNVGWLIDYIAVEHEIPVTCDWCAGDDKDRSVPCLTYESALSVAFAWLLKVVDERG